MMMMGPGRDRPGAVGVWIVDWTSYYTGLDYWTELLGHGLTFCYYFGQFSYYSETSLSGPSEKLKRDPKKLGDQSLEGIQDYFE